MISRGALSVVYYRVNTKPHGIRRKHSSVVKYVQISQFYEKILKLFHRLVCVGSAKVGESIQEVSYKCIVVI